MNYATECFLTSPNELAVTMNCYRLGFSIALGFFIFPWARAVGVGWAFGMAAFFDVIVGIMAALLAWKGQSLRRVSPKWLMVTEDGERVDCTEGESYGQDFLEKERVERPDKH